MLDQFSKLFKEVQEVKDSQIRMETRLDNVISELSGVKQSQVRMETEFGKKLDVLFILQELIQLLLRLRNSNLTQTSAFLYTKIMLA